MRTGVFRTLLCLMVPIVPGTASLFASTRTAAAQELPRRYSAPYAEKAVVVDGKLDDAAWTMAPWTEDFVDIEGDRQPKPAFQTRAKMLWDDNYLYIGAELKEPHLQGTLTVRDSVIFHDNDFEIFIDPDGDTNNYGEFELNALNTGWDLRLTKPYSKGGEADDGWTIDGLKTAVHLNGTINNPSDTDESWTIEVAIPWKGLAALDDPTTPVRKAKREGPLFKEYEPEIRQDAELISKRLTASVTPKPGDEWRINFSRVEWQFNVIDGRYEKVPKTRENNWVWSPQGKIDMHAPETWGYVRFIGKP
jgi:hypothetical protein